MRPISLRTAAGTLHPGVFFPLAVLLLLAACLLSLACGAVKLSIPELFQALWWEPRGIPGRIFWELRLPRTLLAGLTGAGLAVSGAILQGVMRNPLASPGVIGVSAGGGLAGILILLLLPQWSRLLVPAAFLGALATAVLVYIAAWQRGADPLRLILAGVAVASLCGAGGSLLLLLHAEQAAGVLEFTIGSFTSRGWHELRQVQYYLLIGLLIAFTRGRQLNVLSLGDDLAIGLGMRVEATRFLLLSIAAVLAGAAVSAAGLLGFVGLIAPHLIRLIMGTDFRQVLPGAALCGALLTILCDTVGRSVIAPAELPAGILLALLGPPFFLYLLRRRRHEA